MGFIKEKVPDSDWNLFNSFEIYDYNHNRIHTCQPYTNWVVDRERKIYFVYVSGGQNEDQPQQYDLIWNDLKIVVSCEKSTGKFPLTENPLNLHSTYSIISIKIPLKFKEHEKELINLIIDAIEVHHSTNILKNGIFKNENTLNVEIASTPTYEKEVK